jgi:uncharacterized protein (TIGR02217 family)
MAASVEMLSTLILKNKVLSAGLKGRLMFQNQRVSQISGRMSVNAMWEQMLHEYDLSTIQLQRADWQYVQTIHRLTGGGHKGFLMEDPADFNAVSVAVDSSTSGVVAALTSTTFQLYKRYTETASSLYADRRITRPNASYFTLYISGVLKATPADYTLDDDTGIVTIAAAPSAAAVTWTGRFYVPVQFQSDSVDWQLEVPGPEEFRFYSGPAVVLQEVRE